MIALFVLSLGLVAISQASDCSSGDVDYMCQNLDTCWRELAFSSKDDLQMLCEAQGHTYDNNGGGDSGSMAFITSPPRNITVPEGATAAFRCSADVTVKVTIVKKGEAVAADIIGKKGSPSTQTTIQEIDQAMLQHEGWYVCTAYDNSGVSVTAEAYLEIRDICADSNCKDPQICKADEYEGTYECVCPGDCGNDFAPVCASDCASYFNECTMKKETCEKGLNGVTVITTGLCNFTPSKPRFSVTPVTGQTFDEGGAAILSARASGTPDPVYNWFKGNKLIGTGADMTVQMTTAHDGTWRVEASNCHNTNMVSFQFQVKVEASNLVEPDMQCCKVYGDPHIISFDKLKWDYMGSCTYVLAQEKNNAEWMVYGEFQPCGPVGKQVSCITSITIFYKSEMIQFLRMFRINYRGEEFAVNFGQTKQVGELKIENKAMKYYITIGDTGVRVMWDGIITSETCLPNKCQAAVSGICGNADCDNTNEFDRRGSMNPYTQSWKAKTSSEFGNSWAVDPTGCDLEPEDGSLAPERKRPCDFIPAADKAYYEERCLAVLQLDAFSNCVSGTDIDTEALLANCMFDSCIGLVYGGGCGKGAAAAKCKADLERKIVQYMSKNGVGRAEATAYFQGSTYDPACMMGMALADDCRSWGAMISVEWRGDIAPVCPSDEDLININMCA